MRDRLIPGVELQRVEEREFLLHAHLAELTDVLSAEQDGQRDRIEPQTVAVEADLLLFALSLRPGGFLARLLGIKPGELQPGAEARRAPPHLAVIGEEPGVRIREARAADRAGAAGGPDLEGIVYGFAVLQNHGGDLALAERNRGCHVSLQFGKRPLRDIKLRHREFDAVFVIAGELREVMRVDDLPIHPKRVVVVLHGPLRKFGVDTLAVRDKRREEHHFLSVSGLADRLHNGGRRLRPHLHVAVRTGLNAELHIDEAKEVIELCHRRHGGLPAAARRALLDSDSRRNAEHRVHIRAARGLHDRAGIGVKRLEIASLAFVKDDVERESRLPGAGESGDHREFIPGNVD